MQVFLKALLDMAVKARNLAPRGELGPEGWTWPRGVKICCSPLHSSIDWEYFHPLGAKVRPQKAVFYRKARHEVCAYARVDAYAKVVPAPISHLSANFFRRHENPPSGAYSCWKKLASGRVPCRESESACRGKLWRPPAGTPTPPTPWLRTRWRPESIEILSECREILRNHKRNHGNPKRHHRNLEKS
jgi:hypothetical protein